MHVSQVPLGIELKSEQKLDEMVAILDSLQKYVPMVPKTKNVTVPGCTSEVKVTKNVFFNICIGMQSIIIICY